MCYFVREVLSLRMLLLEREDGGTWKDPVWNCMTCHLLHIDGQVYSSFIIVLV
jgi:Zn-finger protein